VSKLFFLVAGEASGDILGAGLIQSLKQHYPNARFKGIGGQLMQAQGLESLYPMERLSVMGIVPILKRLPELLKMRSDLAKTIINESPDCFIGIDAPEFNIGLAYRLKKQNITTVHCVSPSVWAWREKRIYKIAKSVSLMICLFPFELNIYKKHKVAAVCIGHPLADEIPMQANPIEARDTLNLKQDATTIALLPGSRGSEIKYLLPDFINAAEKIAKKYSNIEFVLPYANQKCHRLIQDYLNNHQVSFSIKLIDGQSRLAMQAANIVLLASGTATLEAMLLKKPMLVAYKVSGFSYWVYKKLLKINSFSLPNLLAQKKLVKELMQDDCTVDNLYHSLVELIEKKETQEMIATFNQLHQDLQLGGSEKAAKAIVDFLSDADLSSGKIVYEK
jgi:lipid-A-disaccharide synthase